MKVAVVGSGVAGLIAARTLALAGVNVVLYEKESHIGGHTYNLHVGEVDIDMGFMVCNEVTYPNMLSFFGEVGVEMETSDMSFSVSLGDGKGCEWGSSSLSGLFAQKRNLVNPYFWNMIREVVKFKTDVLNYLKKVDANDTSIDPNATLGEFLRSHGYSQKFIECYLIPVCASIWSCCSQSALGFSAVSILTFCRNHHLLQLFGRPQWLTVQGRSKIYVNKILEELKFANSEIRTSTAVTRIKTLDDGTVELEDAKGLIEVFDKCVVAAHAPDALEMRGQDATEIEKAVLGAFEYAYSDIYLHRDKAYMPRNPAAWSAWNFLGDVKGKVCVSYWLNLIQNLGDTGLPYLMTLNPPKAPNHVERLWRTSHPVPNPAAANASKRMGSIQGYNGVWYCGAYQGYGFHEDGFMSGLATAKLLLKQKFAALALVKQMVPAWSEFAAQQVVIAGLKKFVLTGKLRISEAGGSVYEFLGNEKGCDINCKLRIYNPGFYWKVATSGDLGLADSYIDGDFSFVGDPTNNLFNFLQLINANKVRGRKLESPFQYRDWQCPQFVKTALGSALSYLEPVLRDNSHGSTGRKHFELNEEIISLFLDETMTFSCAIFKEPDDKLKDAQLRKLHTIISKAKIDESHHVLEIGCGWGSMAVEVVRSTGCRYTGITSSRVQLAFAQRRVNEAGFQDRVTLLLADYGKLPHHIKYDRIISCENLEAVGFDNYTQFFTKCDVLLVENGLLVLQTTTVPDERYDEYQSSPDFVRKYIFPGRSLPSLNAIKSAMDAGSTLSVQDVENITPQYVQTLKRWRENFLANSSEIKRLCYDDKFIRMWEYYFDYSAVCFQSSTLGNTQLILSRPVH